MRLGFVTDGGGKGTPFLGTGILLGLGLF